MRCNTDTFSESSGGDFCIGGPHPFTVPAQVYAYATRWKVDVNPPPNIEVPSPDFKTEYDKLISFRKEYCIIIFNIMTFFQKV